MFDTSAVLTGLNDEQRQAVTHGTGPLLIVAGAGTGKTRTLVSRLAWLVANGVPAQRILLLTFTRRAAADMVGRACTLLAAGGTTVGRVTGGTFHSVAYATLRRHAGAFGLEGGFSVMDAGDAADLMDLLRSELGAEQHPRRFPRKDTLVDIYSRTVNMQRPLSQVLDEAFPWCAEHRALLADLFRAYAHRKRATYLVDLDDLLLHWRAAACDEALGPRLAEAYDHVLVDEYQDVNGLQADIVRALRACNDNVTVVGDDAQAIYGFRAASADHILDFPLQFTDTTVVTLHRSYRSTQAVLDVANAVAAAATRSHPKVLRATAPGGPRPRILTVDDEAAEARLICDAVLDGRERGMLLRDQAVLFRAGPHSAALELELLRRGVPFRKYGGLRYLETAHVKDLLALLRVVHNVGDEVAWHRVLQLLDGVGPATARRVIAAVTSDEPGTAAAALPASARDAGAALLVALDAARQERRPSEQLRIVADVLRPLLRSSYPDASVRIDDIDRLVMLAGDRSDLSAFVAELVLDPPASTSDLAAPPDLDEDYLVLSTIHSAKGLEWDAVHVLRVTDGNIPSDMALTSPAGLEEERRLLYVAVTRARRELTLYAPLRFHHRPAGRDDAHGFTRLSRFCDQRVQALCDVRAAPAQPLDTRTAGHPPARITVDVDSLWS